MISGQNVAVQPATDGRQHGGELPHQRHCLRIERVPRLGVVALRTAKPQSKAHLNQQRIQHRIQRMANEVIFAFMAQIVRPQSHRE
ncbi:hypothetical protein D3C79_917000 [compost metagenome]